MGRLYGWLLLVAIILTSIVNIALAVCVYYAWLEE